MVYLGSVCVFEMYLYYVCMCEFVKDIVMLLDCMMWFGLGFGFMDAATRGVFDVERVVVGFMIFFEVGGVR